MSEACASSDLAKTNRRWILWGLPTGLLVLGAFTPTFRALLWTPALLLAGGACVVNAATCRRLHCYMTGPLYLLMALATVLVSLEVVSIPWSFIGLGVVGGTVLAYVPEWVRGQYVAPKA